MRRWLHLIDVVGPSGEHQAVYKHIYKNTLRVTVTLEADTEDWHAMAKLIRDDALTDAELCYACGDEEQAVKAGKVAGIIRTMLSKET